MKLFFVNVANLVGSNVDLFNTAAVLLLNFVEVVV